MSCDAATLMQSAGCLIGCVPKGMEASIQTYLLARIAGGSLDPQQLMSDAKAYCCLPAGLLPRIKNYLLCQIVNNSGSPIPEPPECDADAQAFIAAAGITEGSTEANAVCALVQDLKSYPASGTKYWDRDEVIYPFVSNPGDAAAVKAVSHSYNLKNPALYQINWVGAGLTHSSRGVKGDGAASYGQTFYEPIPQNTIRGCYYLDINATAGNNYIWGRLNLFAVRNTATNIVSRVNDNSSIGSNNFTQEGLIIVQRYNAVNRQVGYRSAPWQVQIAASDVIRPQYLALFCANTANVPGWTPVAYANAQVSSFSWGDPLDTDGANTEHLEYKWIWDKFHATLGRAHP